MIAPTFFKASWVDWVPLNHENSPEVLLTTFKIIPKVVDFPLPFGPKIPYTFPLRISKERLFTACTAPYFLSRFLSDKIVSKEMFLISYENMTTNIQFCYKEKLQLFTRFITSSLGAVTHNKM